MSSTVYINNANINSASSFTEGILLQYTDGTISDLPSNNQSEQDDILIEKTILEDGSLYEDDPNIQCVGTRSDIQYINNGKTWVFVRHHTESDDDICTYMWHDNFEQCMNYANNNNIPMITVWTNGLMCEDCNRLESALMDKKFREWQMENKIVYCMISSSDKDGKVNSAAFNHIGGYHTDVYERKTFYNLTNFPFVNFWWMVDGDVKIDMCLTGSQADGNQSGSKGSENFIQTVNTYIQSQKNS